MKGAENAEAFELYQRGRALWQTRSGENLHQATVLLEQAVRKNPDFALAHSALADCYAFDYSDWKKAETEAREAIRLDANLGEPHATIGFVKMFWEWNLKEAEDEFKQAVRLSPNYATGHQWYAVLLSATDRHNAAYAEMRQALDLEPDSLSINADLCQTLYFTSRYDEAIAQCQKTLGMNDKFHNAHSYLYEIYNANGMFREAFEQFFKNEEIAGIKMPPEIIEKFRTAYKTGGIRAFWRARIEAFKGGKAPECYKIAQYYARLGEKEEALKWLGEAYQTRDFNFILLLADPTFDDFHGDRRFNELMPFITALEN
jgi:tetratricopeptide (TPR) repeat protein